MFCCFTGNAGQHIIFNFVFLQKPQTTHHLSKRPFVFTVAAITVMNFFWTVNTNAYHKVVLLQKVTPLICK